MNTPVSWEQLLASVEKPSRYIGGEINAARIDRQACRLSFALAFPDTYEVGMSHLGLQILYAILNGLPGVIAERFFAPWPDMEKLLREHRFSLSSLESHTALNRFDVVGFSLQYELSYTNVLNMLDLGGIPLHASGRRDGDPVVIAGGPCAFNPGAMGDFIDAFVIGEGEEVIGEITETLMRAKSQGQGRQQMIAGLADIEGVYVPARHGHDAKIRKRIVMDLNRWPHPARPLVPLMKTIHDRVTLEVARGCTRGCRFCQAGMVWRPLRERGQDVLTKMADEMLCATGHDELSLLSLSSGDYSRIEPLLMTFMARYYDRRVALALPSLRVETLSQKMIEIIQQVRKTSFTLAPEAGTQRLRNIINKGNTESQLLDTVGRVFAAGWRSVKLYFMIGLPEETQEDMAGIVDLGFKALQEGRHRGLVTINLSTFVPKPHTPFQWVRQISLEETLQKQAFIKKHIRHRNMTVKWHDARMSFLEGLFSRGDRRLGALLEKAFQRGCRFDGWSDFFRFDEWEDVIREGNIDVREALQGCDPAVPLPWDNIDCGIGKTFLAAEYRRSTRGELTPDCRKESCSHCGVCDHQAIKNVTADGPDQEYVTDAGREKDPPPLATKSLGGEGAPKLIRICFSKRGKARFLSHLELSAGLVRAIKRSSIHFVYSQGHHPHPKISFAFATPVGMESLGEYAEMQMVNPGSDMEKLKKEINPFLPEGVEILAMEPVLPGGLSLSERVNGFAYHAVLPASMTMTDLRDMEEKIDRFRQTDQYPVTREIKGKRVVKNIAPLVENLSVDREKHGISMLIRVAREGTVRPVDILTEVLGIEPLVARGMPVTKTVTNFR